jgi:pyruvate/2-oxoglutarate dehydrogenase complex dihydrolipoamide dehydrogenase (E3) component
LVCQIRWRRIERPVVDHATSKRRVLPIDVKSGAQGLCSFVDRLETNAPDVWAIGECAGSPQFTHVSEDDFRIIRDNLAGGDRTTRNRLVPYLAIRLPGAPR